MKLLGNNITYDAYTAATLTADDNMQGRIEDIKDEISSNFLKVKHTSSMLELIAALDQFRNFLRLTFSSGVWKQQILWNTQSTQLQVL